MFLELTNAKYLQEQLVHNKCAVENSCLNLFSATITILQSRHFKTIETYLTQDSGVWEGQEHGTGIW